MSNDYNRGYNDAQNQAAITETIVGLSRSRNHQAAIDEWEAAADQQHARALRAEQRLSAALEDIETLEKQVRSLKSQIAEMEEARDKVLKLTEEFVDSNDKDRARLMAAFHERDATARKYWEQAKHYAEESERQRGLALAAACAGVEMGQAIRADLRTSGAMTAGFEAIYKMLVLEIVQKHDPTTFDSLDPKKRISVMDEAWLHFMQTQQYEHFPDLSFSYATPRASSQDEAGENLKVEGAAGVAQEPEEQ